MQRYLLYNIIKYMYDKMCVKKKIKMRNKMQPHKKLYECE